jgi:LuxR family maltose regulon positive regulatory protein
VTVRGEQPQVRRERRIIERPRLIKLLDECEAPIILLLAPAGYGKTTLARQWAKTLNGAIWVSLTPAHRDVARLAEDIAAGIDALGGHAGKFIGEYLRSRGNPQRAARDVAVVLSEHLARSRAQWLLIDDYHELLNAPEADEVLSYLQEQGQVRTFVTTRGRPAWATPRRALYGELFEIDRAALAMDVDESKLVLGRRTDLLALASQAEGWPAVLGLAAGMTASSPPVGVLPASLHDYLAEELYESAPSAVQEALLSFALAPEVSREVVTAKVGTAGSEMLDQIRNLGFLSTEHEAELHPLIREFLLQKLATDQNSHALARDAVVQCLERERWDRAFELVLRFDLLDLVDQLIEAAYGPLIRSGHLGTLSAFAAAVGTEGSFPPPGVELVDAEVALRDGASRLAADLASRVGDHLPPGHPLSSKASKIVAQAAFTEGDLPRAVASYDRAHSTAKDEQDEADALYGWAMASVQGEIVGSDDVLKELYERRHRSPLDLVRFGTADLARKRFREGFRDPLEVDEYLHALRLVEDPRARTSFAYSVAYTLAVCADYRRALKFAESGKAEVDAYDLDFARPHSDWNLACIHLGLRRFGAAERALQLVEDSTEQRPLGFHVLNARVLRMRLALQTGEINRAVELVRAHDNESAIPSIHAEHIATQGLCVAIAGRMEEALLAARSAEQLTSAVEVRVLAQAVRAIVAASQDEPDPGLALLGLAGELGAWDPVVVALRASRQLSDLLARVGEARPRLELLYQRSNDAALARRAGFRRRSPKAPDEILSPREMEVLQLLARGFRNREIAKALVISDSTTKVHVRHILEKMGVRTRTEAVARLGLFQ